MKKLFIALIAASLLILASVAVASAKDTACSDDASRPAGGNPGAGIAKTNNDDNATSRWHGKVSGQCSTDSPDPGDSGDNRQDP